MDLLMLDWYLKELPLIMIYECICFVGLMCTSILLSSAVVDRMVEPNSSCTDGHVIAECILSLVILVILTSYYEILEMPIRARINTLKTEHSQTALNIPSIAAILLFFLNCWCLTTIFYDRFDIVINERNPKGPSACLDHWWTYAKNGQFSFQLKEGSLEALHRAEAYNTTCFVTAITFITYFLWKTALKKIPLNHFIFTKSAVRRLFEDVVLISVSLIVIGGFDIVTKGRANGKCCDLIMVMTVGALAVGAEFIQWDYIIDCSPEEEDTPCSGGGQNLTPGSKKLYSYWIHALLYLLGISAVIYVFFQGGIMGEPTWNELENEFQAIQNPIEDASKPKGDFKSDLAKSEFDKDARKLTTFYRLLVGTSLLMAGRTFIGYRF